MKSQQMFALCDAGEKDSSPTESPTEERGLMIGQNPKSGSSTLFSSAEIGIREISFLKTDVAMNRWGANFVPKLRAKKQKLGFSGTVVEVIRYIETAAKITGGKWKESWTRRTYALQAKAIYIKPC